MKKNVGMGLMVVATVVASSAAASEPATADSVQQTVDRIIERLEDQGFRIEGIVNHAAAAASVGLELPPTQVVFFGQGRKDATLIRRGRTVALDLPLRFLVYQDSNGGVQVQTNDIGFLVDRHGLRILDGRLRRLGRVLDQFGGADNGIRTVQSKRSFDDTSAYLLAELQTRGFRVPLTINYSERARYVRPTQIVLFGNPNVGTPLMQGERSIALDLPQKMLIYTNRAGETFLAYNDPFFLAKKHGLTGQEARLGNIANALRAIAEAAAGIN